MVFDIARACEYFLGEEAYTMATAFAIVKFDFEKFKELPREQELKGDTCLIRVGDEGGTESVVYLRFVAGSVYRTRIVIPENEKKAKGGGGRRVREFVDVDDKKIMEISKEPITSIERFL